ncbi:hypothetical protein VTN31DRAFT_774 [Thermomyces dupontii]|uniref:uncharacterized protein n=1 Tax=Talaromyces thermophilus TaxID=28565 RepID=UPI00374204AB
MEDGGADTPTTANTPPAADAPRRQQQQSSPERSRSASTASSRSSAQNKRGVSGTLLSKIPFLRMNSNFGKTASEQLAMVDNNASGTVQGSNDVADAQAEATGRSLAAAEVGGNGRAMAAAMQQHQRKMRRRRGSLRKTALLGTRADKSRHRSTSTSAGATTDQQQQQSYATGSAASEDSSMAARLGGGGQQQSSNSSYWAHSHPHHVHDSRHSHSLDLSTSSVSPAGTDVNPSSSNTGGFERMSLPPRPVLRRPSAGNNNADINKSHDGQMPPKPRHHPAPISIPTPPSSTDSSYYVPDSVLRQPGARSSLSSTEDAITPTSTTTNTMDHHHPKPPKSHVVGGGGSGTSAAAAAAAAAAAHAHAAASDDSAWDYAETEWWGWIILLVTWLVFVVVMGSCFGVWSWAWDVGQTPYAPPELEDDPTLPITGYYPALMVMTAVMSWVWVVVAWVGMKYFRHANISGDD